MTEPSANEITALLLAWNQGDPSALEKLTPLVYRERRILVDFARSRNYLKRGGEAPRASLSEAFEVAGEQEADLVALDDALQNLASVDPRKCRVVELRFFGGLSVEETAEVLQVSPDTVKRNWRLAKLWLLREFSRGERNEA